MRWYESWSIAAPLAFGVSVLLIVVGTWPKRRNRRVLRAPDSRCQRAGVESVP